MSLAEASQSRKERLAALRARRAGEAPSDEPIKVKPRNFDPESRTAKKFSQSDLPETVEQQVKGVAKQIAADDEARRQEELNLLNIAPKRPNWDLKRDLDRINLKLKPQTDEAIRKIIRARLTAQKGSGKELDLASALNALQDVGSDDERAPSDDDE